MSVHSHHVLLRGAAAGADRLWYVPRRELRTKRSAQEAVRLVRALRHPPVEPAVDELSLFLALHTCAYAANRSARAGDTARQRLWTRRWRAIRDHLVEQNLGLCYIMLGRFRVADSDHDDMLGDAMYALTRAVDRFDPGRGYRFSTYACNVIARALMRRSRADMRRHQLITFNSDIPLTEPDSPKPVGDTTLFVERLHLAMRDNAGKLTELESHIIDHRFPLSDKPALTFRQIGEQVGLSKERIRQIQKTALTKIRNALRGDPFLK